MRIVAPLVLAVFATALSVPAPAGAAKPLKISSAKASGNPVVVPGKTTKVKVRVAVSGRRITDVDVALERVGGGGFALVNDMELVSGKAGKGVWQGTAELDREDWGGRYTLEVAATDGTSKDSYYEFKVRTFKNALKVRRAARLKVSAAPNTLDKGAKVRVRGKLRGLNRKGKFTALKQQKVEIWFRPKGKKATRVAVVRTNAKGLYSRRIAVQKDGAFSVRYKGTAVWQKKVTGWKNIDVR